MLENNTKRDSKQKDLIEKKTEQYENFFGSFRVCYRTMKLILSRSQLVFPSLSSEVYAIESICYNACSLLEVV